MDYILMNKNTPVLKLSMDEGYIISIVEIYNTSYLPVEVSPKPDLIKSTLREWWSGRRIPASRDKIRDGLFNIGILTDQMPAFLLEKCFGLSLSDQYWINPANEPLNWADINFFENDFSDDMGVALFDNQRIGTPDLLSPDNTSDGWLKKKWKIIDGNRCLIKAGARPYYQQPFNEVIASIVCEHLGIEVHVDYELGFENGEPVSICKNFITEDTELVSANSIMSRKKKPNDVSYYDHYVALCQDAGVTDICDRLDEMIVLDYIIRNEDRHYRNFGLIRNVETLKYIGVAPIFDSGTSLLLDTATEDIIKNCVDKDSPSKPFKFTHDRQIQLISNPTRFDLTKLHGIDDEIYKVLKTGSVISEARIELLCKAVVQRIEKLSRLLSKLHLHQAKMTMTSADRDCLQQTKIFRQD